MAKARRVFLTLMEDDAFWGNGDGVEDGGRQRYRMMAKKKDQEVEEEEEEGEEEEEEREKVVDEENLDVVGGGGGGYYFNEELAEEGADDDDFQPVIGHGGMGDNRRQNHFPLPPNPIKIHDSFECGFGNLKENRNGFENSRLQVKEIQKLRTVSICSDSGKSDGSMVSSMEHSSTKTEKMYSDEEKSEQKDSGAASIDSNDAYNAGYRNFLRNRPENEVHLFLESPFDCTDEKFFEEYEKVRKGFESCAEWETLYQLRRNSSNDAFLPNSHSRVCVPMSNFRKPDRRLGKYSKYYYHHNVGSEVYSRKVFVGGLPSCVSEEEITSFFSRYGRLQVDWPSKHHAFKSDSEPSLTESPNHIHNHVGTTHINMNLPTFGDANQFMAADCSTMSQMELAMGGCRKSQHLGYVFLLFEKERSVRDLVAECFEETEGLFIPLELTSDNVRVQIRPWLLADAEFLMDFNVPINTKLVAFIGGVPRPLKAVELAHFFEQMYGNVVCVGIDIDNKFKYPRGSGRVAFSNHDAYAQAITDRYIILDHEDIHKRVEIKPYFFHNQSCEECSGRFHRQHAPYFCPSLECFQYYCEPCWQKMHTHPSRYHHMPVVKGV